MEYIKNNFYVGTHNKKVTNYNYNFLDILKYHINTNIYINALENLDIYLLKNIWNSIVKEWSTMQIIMKKDKNFQNSKYSKDKYNHTHILIFHDELNDLVRQFIDNDEFKALFVVNCIINSIC